MDDEHTSVTVTFNRKSTKALPAPPLPKRRFSTPNPPPASNPEIPSAPPPDSKQELTLAQVTGVIDGLSLIESLLYNVFATFYYSARQTVARNYATELKKQIVERANSKQFKQRHPNLKQEQKRIGMFLSQRIDISLNTLLHRAMLDEDIDLLQFLSTFNHLNTKIKNREEQTPEDILAIQTTSATRVSCTHDESVRNSERMQRLAQLLASIEKKSV